MDVSDWAYFDLVHMNGTTWTRTDGWIVWGMFIGALITILLATISRSECRDRNGGTFRDLQEESSRASEPGWLWAQSRTGVPQFSLHSWIFIVATGAGTFLGARLVNTRWWKGKPVLKMGGTAPSVKPGKNRQPYSGVCWSCLHRADRIFLRNWSHDAWNSRPFGRHSVF